MILIERTYQLQMALLKEIELTRDYLENEPVETIYFGGGTPSLLKSGQELLHLVRAILVDKVCDDADALCVRKNSLFRIS